MALTPINGDLLAGVASKRTETINASPDPWITGDSPQQMTLPYPLKGGIAFRAREVVGFDGSGLIVPATYSAVAGAKATGTLTFSGVGTEGDTITIGGRVYTLSATMDAVDKVLIGASATATALNFVRAINADAATAGISYGTGTTDNAAVSATSAAGVVTVTARQGGAGGNAITTTETGSATAWGGAVMTGGAGAETGVKAVGIIVYAASSVALADGAVVAEVYRQGIFNPDLAVWDDSFDTAAKKQMAFEGAPTPTAIGMRRPTTMTTT